MTDWTDQPTNAELNAELDPDIDGRAVDHIVTHNATCGWDGRPDSCRDYSPPAADAFRLDGRAYPSGDQLPETQRDRWSEALAGGYVMRGHLHEGPGGNHSRAELASFTVSYRNERARRDWTFDPGLSSSESAAYLGLDPQP